MTRSRTTPILWAALVLVALPLLASAAPAAETLALQGPTTPILDDFNRANEDPLYQWGNWALGSIDGAGQTLEIVSNRAGHNESSDAGLEADSYRPVEISGDAEVYATFASLGGGQWYLYLHLQQVGGAGWDGYRARWTVSSASDSFRIEKVVDGVATTLANGGGIEAANGDTVLLRRLGNSLEFWWLRPPGSWTQLLTATDATYQSGKLGLGMNSIGFGWDDFGGSGSTTQPPPPLAPPQTPVLDDFNRPNEDPLSQGGAWASTSFGGSGITLEVISNQAAQNETTGFAASYRTADVSGDAEVYATVSVAPGNNEYMDLYLHLQQPAELSVAGYRARWHHWAGTDSITIQRFDAVGTTNLVFANLEPPAGDTLLLRRRGNGLELWRKNAGVWTQLATTQDATYQSGKLGLGSITDHGFWDNFGGGAFFANPPPPEQCYGGSYMDAICPSVTLSDPVNTFTGTFSTQIEDLALPGTGVSFAWSRSYTSADTTVGRLGPGWTDGYASSLLIQGSGDVIVHGEEGQQIYYTKQGDGSFVGAPGSLSTLSSIAGGYKLVRTDQVTSLFDTQGRLTSTKDRNDQGLTLAYDGQGRLATITDAAGRQASVSYNASNLVSQVATQDGRSVSYGYTGGLLTSVTDVRGKPWAYTYASGRLATIVDPLNHTQVTNVYGADGRVSSQTDAVGKTTTFAWDPVTQLATVTDANQKVWKDDYASNILASRTDPLNDVTEFAHDADLNTTSVESPTNEATTMTYDAAGNPLTATAPASLGSVQKTFLYNIRNDPTQITDARSKVTSYTYDTSGNTSSVTQDGVQVAAYTYDTAGRVLTFTDGNQKTTTYTYFPTTGYLESVTDPLGNKTTYTYDGAGRVLTRVDPKGNCAGCTPADFTWSYTYNAAGQVLTETDPLGNVTTHTYDDAGNELTVTDANLKTTTYAYDSANRLLSVTAPDTGVTSYTYDNVGNKLTETDPLNHTTTSTYDSANRLASTTTASGAKTTFFYDANGNLTKQVEPRGNVGGGVNPDDYATTFTYDAAGRLLTETDPLGNMTTHIYDAVGNELTVKDANLKTTTSTYDGLNRLATITVPDGGRDDLHLRPGR